MATTRVISGVTSAMFLERQRAGDRDDQRGDSERAADQCAVSGLRMPGARAPRYAVAEADREA